MSNGTASLKSSGNNVVGRERGRSFWLVLGFILATMTVVHFNSQRVVHAEGDEVVFVFLAERLSEHLLQYNVQGELTGRTAAQFRHDVMQQPMDDSEASTKPFSLIWVQSDPKGQFEPRYEPKIYGRDLFFHPPLYPYSLMLARVLGGATLGVFLSTLFHALTVLFIALIGRILANDTVGLIAAGLMAVESVSWTCGERLWIDGMLQMTVTGAALAALWSARQGGVWCFILAGACLGLAGLTKLPAGLLAPSVVVIWLLSERRPRWIEMLSYIAMCAAMVAPWLILARTYYGSYLPSERPTVWMLAQFPWVRLVVHRPEWYYVFGLLLVSPILLYCIAGVSRLRWDDWLWIPVAWAGAFLVALTVIGAQGMGYQLRYLAPALPAMCLLAAAGVEFMPMRWRIPVLALAAYTLMVGVHTGLTAGLVDPRPDALAEFIKDLSSWDFRQAIPGVW